MVLLRRHPRLVVLPPVALPVVPGLAGLPGLRGSVLARRSSSSPATPAARLVPLARVVRAAPGVPPLVLVSAAGARTGVAHVLLRHRTVRFTPVGLARPAVVSPPLLRSPRRTAPRVRVRRVGPAATPVVRVAVLPPPAVVQVLRVHAVHLAQRVRAARVVVLVVARQRVVTGVEVLSTVLVGVARTLKTPQVGTPQPVNPRVRSGTRPYIYRLTSDFDVLKVVDRRRGEQGTRRPGSGVTDGSSTEAAGPTVGEPPNRSGYLPTFLLRRQKEGTGSGRGR